MIYSHRPYRWTVAWARQGIAPAEFRSVKRWFEESSDRHAVQRGLAVTAGVAENPADLTPEEQARRHGILFRQRVRSVPEAPATVGP